MKPKENNGLEPKKQQNIRKTNIWQAKNNKTIGKQRFESKKATKPKENQQIPRHSH